ncbi:hypothetical protein D3C75_865880 [compost metagenome]
MKRSLAAWLTIMSIATVVKFISMISATGRMPTNEEPIAAPIMACSEIGVERTLEPPNLVDSPLVTPITPPPSRSATSSPKTITFLSADIASSSARLMAWIMFRLVGEALMQGSPRRRHHGAVRPGPDRGYSSQRQTPHRSRGRLPFRYRATAPRSRDCWPAASF